MGYVRLHGRLRDVEPPRDLRVRRSLGHQQEHLALALRQIVECSGGRRRLRPARELTDQPPGDRWRQKGIAGGDDPYRRHQLLRRSVLQKEPAGAGAERIVNVLVEIERREDQDLGGPVLGGDPTRRLDAVHRGHPHVHHDDVGTLPGERTYRVGAVDRLADDLDVLLGVEDQAEPAAHQRLIVGDHDPDRHDDPSCASGISAWTANPPPWRIPVSSTPPYSPTRSRIPTRPWPGSSLVDGPTPSSSTSITIRASS